MAEMATGTNDDVELQIKRSAALKRKGITQRKLAQDWERSQSFVCQMVAGTLRSHRYERKFAELVGIPWEKLFTTASIRNPMPVDEPETTTE